MINALEGYRKIKNKMENVHQMEDNPEKMLVAFLQ
jgi:hypothetical protein